MKLKTLLSIFLSGLILSFFAMQADIQAHQHSFQVAIILPRSVNADGWTRSGYQGLLLIEKELGAKVSYSEAVPENQFEKVFRQYATTGYDFIIGHGGQFVAAAEKVAREFPHTNFAVTTKYGGNNVNLGGLSIREGEMGYLFGAIAAIKSKTKHVGYLAGVQYAVNKESTELFKRGALATDPAIKVSIKWVGNWTDKEKAKNLAKSMINAGVDVIMVNAGAASMGVHAQAEKAGIYTLAWIKDFNYLAPKAVITSNIQKLPFMLLRGAMLAKQGRWEGKQYKFGLAEGVNRLAPFYGLLTPEEERRVIAIKNDLLTGKIDTTY